MGAQPAAGNPNAIGFVPKYGSAAPSGATSSGDCDITMPTMPPSAIARAQYPIAPCADTA